MVWIWQWYDIDMVLIINNWLSHYYECLSFPSQKRNAYFMLIIVLISYHLKHWHVNTNLHMNQHFKIHRFIIQYISVLYQCWFNVDLLTLIKQWFIYAHSMLIMKWSMLIFSESTIINIDSILVSLTSTLTYHVNVSDIWNCCLFTGSTNV